MKTIFIATDGNDKETGTKRHPFQTIGRALKELKKFRALGEQDITVYFREGVYLPEYDTINVNLRNKITQKGENVYPLRVSRFELDEKSGTENGRVIFSAYKKERVIITGGKLLTNWVLHDGEKRIYKAFIGIQTRHLYVNGRRIMRARSDAAAFAGSILNTECHKDSTPAYVLRGHHAEFREPDAVELVYRSLFTQPRADIQKIEYDESNTFIYMKQPGFYYITHKGGTSVNYPAYLENAYEFLKEPDYFFYSNKDGYVYYIPREEENIEEAQVICPVIDVLLSVRGAGKSKPVKNITFRNLYFEYTGWLRPSYANGHSDAQNNYIRECGADMASEDNDSLCPAALNLEYAENIIFDRCRISKIGITALNITRASKFNKIIGCEFSDISGSAVVIGEIGWRNNENKINVNSKDARDLITGNSVENCYIHDCGVEFLSAAPVAAGYTVNTSILHNDIVNCPYTAIHIGYGWGEVNNVCTRGIRIESNLIDTFMTKMFDGGGVYTLGATGGTERQPNCIRGNFIRNQIEPKFGALYFDEGSSNWIAEKNVFEETPMWCHISVLSSKNHDITVKNNFIGNGYLLFDKKLGQKNIVIEPAKSRERYFRQAESIITKAGLSKRFSFLREDYDRIGKVYFDENAVSCKTGDVLELSLRVRTVRGVLTDQYDLSYTISNDSLVPEGDKMRALKSGRCEAKAFVRQGERRLRAKADIYVDDKDKQANIKMDRTMLRIGQSAEIEMFITTQLGRKYKANNFLIFPLDDRLSVDKTRITAQKGGRGKLLCKYKDLECETSINVFERPDGDPVTDKVFWINNSCSKLTYDKTVMRLSCYEYRGYAYYAGGKLGDMDLFFTLVLDASARDWPGIVFRCQNTDSRCLDKDNSGYMIIIYHEEIQLLKFLQGRRYSLFTDTNGREIKLPNPWIRQKEKCRLRLIVKDTDKGVDITLYANDHLALHCIDGDENAIYGKGYFGLIVNNGEMLIYS